MNRIQSYLLPLLTFSFANKSFSRSKSVVFVDTTSKDKVSLCVSAIVMIALCFYEIVR